MLCFTARKLINQEMDGRLPDRQVRSLAEHIGRCAACAGYREELETGRRLLRATEPEPSESFEWTLQLKLNRALQGVAASTSVPWEDASSRGLTGWMRGFAFSSLAGVAVALAFAVWVLPRGVATTSSPGFGPLVEAGETVSPVTLSAGNPDRRSLSQPRYRSLLPGANSLGRTVSGGRTTQPNLLDRSGWVPSTWNGAGLEDLNAVSSLREENGRLRFMLKQLQSENGRLQALLGDRDINYLESDDSEENR